MKQAPARATNNHAEASVVETGQLRGEEWGQQLIGWRLFVCFAVGAGLWFGALQLVATGLSESATVIRIISVIRIAVMLGGVVSLVLAAMAGLNEMLKRTGPDRGRGAQRGSAASSPTGARGPLL